MMRNRNKKALYELVSRAGFDVDADKTLEPLHPTASSSASTGPKQPPQQLMRWPKRPRMFQVNGGRLEVSVPYQLAVAALMVLILLFLVVFRLGENTAKLQAGISVVDLSKSVENQIRQSMVIGEKPVAAKKATPAAKTKKPAKHTGSNRIVIQTFPLRAHLEPVKQYFAENGIETEIRKIGDRYFLVTADKYQNPERAGTDGYAAKQKIIELGGQYKAPPRRETFGTKPFYDAYGMKFDD